VTEAAILDDALAPQTRPPSQKGTSVLPVVMALKGNPGARKLVPSPLWKYFDEPVLVSGWYPEADYWVLIEALVRTIDPASVGGDVWRYFAQFSAQRDIGGQDVKATSGDSAAQKGVYRTFARADASSPAGFFSRAVRLWSQYHDSGRMEIVGGRGLTNAVIMRLLDFSIPIEGFVRLELESSVTRSTARGQALCEWEHRLAVTPATEAYVASLPSV
jgi:hypothetical protein